MKNTPDCGVGGHDDLVLGGEVTGGRTPMLASAWQEGQGDCVISRRRHCLILALSQEPGRSGRVSGRAEHQAQRDSGSAHLLGCRPAAGR